MLQINISIQVEIDRYLIHRNHTKQVQYPTDSWHAFTDSTLNSSCVKSLHIEQIISNCDTLYC